MFLDTKCSTSAVQSDFLPQSVQEKSDQKGVPISFLFVAFLSHVTKLVEMASLQKKGEKQKTKRNAFTEERKKGFGPGTGHGGISCVLPTTVLGPVA